MIHIEQVLVAFQAFQFAIAKANSEGLWRDPTKWEEKVSKARRVLQTFCEENSLPIDFAPR